MCALQVAPLSRVLLLLLKTPILPLCLLHEFVLLYLFVLELLSFVSFPLVQALQKTTKNFDPGRIGLYNEREIIKNK